MENLSRLYLKGVRIEWKALDAPYSRRKVDLPTYPFQRQRYWIKSLLSFKQSTRTGHPLAGEYINTISEEELFVNELDLKYLPYLKDHQIYDIILFPGTGYIEIFFAVGKQLRGSESIVLKEITIQEPLALSPDKPKHIQVQIKNSDNDSYALSIYSQSEDRSWICHASAQLFKLVSEESRFSDWEAIKQGCNQEVSVADLYRELASKGLHYGPNFQSIKKLWGGKDKVLAELHCEEEIGCFSDPRILDGCFQALSAALMNVSSDEVFLPFGVDEVTLYSKLEITSRMHGQVLEKDEKSISANLEVFSFTGMPLVSIKGFRMRKTSNENLLHMLQKKDQLNSLSYHTVWKPTSIESAKTLQQGDWVVSGKKDRFFEVFTKRMGALSCYCLDMDISKIEDKDQIKGVVYVVSDLQSVLNFVQSFLRLSLSFRPPIYFVTRDAEWLEDSAVSLFQTPFSGFFKSLILEYPDLKARQIDFDNSEEVEDKIGSLLIELSEDDEPQVAYRHGKRFVPRLARLESEKSLKIPTLSSYRLDTSAKGPLTNLILKPVKVPSTLTERQIEIEIKAAGLNFRDVLNAMGLYPGEAGNLGVECAGIISAIGPEVKDFKVGDAVFGFGDGFLANRVISSPLLFVRKPKCLNFEEAASLPIVFSTVVEGLCHLAQLKKGDNVLIHAGAGGVGLAAIQVAQQSGATVFATAGSPEKQDYLRTLGVTHIYSSRHLDYAAEILKDTQGKGVDVVLNSLSGEGFIESTVSACAKNARFIEIGKRGIWTHDEMKNVRPDIAYFIFDLGEMMINKPEEAKKLLSHVASQFEKGTFKPIHYKSFDLTEAQKAFQYLQRAKNIGKVILVPPKGKVAIDPEGSYLITGGFGGLGLKIAQWLADQGATHLVLVGRTVPEEIHLKAKSVIIESVGLDISDELGVKTLIPNFGVQWPRLKGIFHAAGVLDDGAILSLDWSRFEKVFAPKVRGAWNLHCATKGLDLDYFVLFSSIASLMGSPGQSNYAAANSFLDALAYDRKLHHLPALSINWGSWSEVGMAKDLASRHEASGFKPLTPVQGIESLERAMQKNISNIAITNIDWKRVKVKGAFFSDFATQAESKAAKLLEQLQKIEQSKMMSFLQDYLSHMIVGVIGLSPDVHINDNKGFFDMGLDSLMALELKNKLQDEIGPICQISATFVFDHPNINAVMKFFEEEIFPAIGIKKPGKELSIDEIERLIK